MLDKLALDVDVRDWFADQFLISIAGLCIVTDNTECAADALARHPLAKNANLVENGRFRNAMAYLYAAAKTIVDVYSGRNVADQWLDALEGDANGVENQSDRNLMQSYGRIARGVAIAALPVRDDVSTTSRSEMLQAADLRLTWLEKEAVGFYQPDVATDSWSRLDFV